MRFPTMLNRDSMNYYTVPFGKIDQDEDFRSLALTTGGQLEGGSTTIRCRGNTANGTIKRWHLDAGLHMRVWELVFLAPVELHKESAPLYIPNFGYNLLCILTPDTVSLKSVNQQQQVSKTRDKTLVLSPDMANTILQVEEGAPVQLIDFQIAPYWFRDQPGYTQISKYFEESVPDSNQLPLLIESCTKKISQQAAKLFNTAIAGQPISTLLISGQILITEFLETINKIESDRTCGNIAIYYEKIMEAEDILIAYLHGSLPRLDKVAKQVALSESTLKRYFKLVFGKSIYEYYLNKKMEKAHELLLEKPLSVNEAAELMGYEKVSNFIDMFKKYHGYSPGTIRKNNSMTQDTGNGGKFIA